MFKKMMRNEKGYSIIQIIVVIAVIGILMAVLIPNFGNVFGATKNAGYKVDGNTIFQSVSSETIPTNVLPSTIAELEAIVLDAEYDAGTATDAFLDTTEGTVTIAAPGATIAGDITVFSDLKDNVAYLLATTTANDAIYMLYPNNKGIKLTKTNNGVVSQEEITFTIASDVITPSK